MDFYLTRITYGTHTFGILSDGTQPLFTTLELPNNENKSNISCIPTGKYRLTKYDGTKFKKSFWVHDVPNRHAIMIHVGNYLTDTKGCILLGKSFMKNGITNSRRAMRQLNEIADFENTLTVLEANWNV